MQSQRADVVQSAPKVPELMVRYREQMEGELRCFDRVIFQGTLVDVAHPGAMASYLLRTRRKVSDLVAFAQPLNEEIRENAERLAREQGLKVEYIQRRDFRLEDRVAEVLKTRGTYPGLVHIFSAKERATVFEVLTSGQTGHSTLVSRSGLCLHYYFYFLDEELGLIYVRVPTWLPFRLQIYLNGHNVLARQLEKEAIPYEQMDNCFLHIAQWDRAQALADTLGPKALRSRLDSLARLCCPPTALFEHGYHWSFMQVEYSWDVVFKDPATMSVLFETLSREAIQTVRSEDVGRFFGKRLPHGHDTPVDSHLGRRVEAFRLRHQMGPTSLKLYTKHHRVFRIECTTKDVSFFQHHREVEHRDGTKEFKVAAMKKSIYSLEALRAVMTAALRRYLEWLSALQDQSPGTVEVDRLAESKRDEKNRSYRGFNLLRASERQMLCTVVSGNFAAAGLSHRRLRAFFSELSPGQLGRLIKRLRVHGLLKKVGHTYRYYVTAVGRKLSLAALRVHQSIIVSALSSQPTSQGHTEKCYAS